MTKQEIIDYVMTTPSNPNKAVLEGMLDSFSDDEGGGGGSSRILLYENDALDISSEDKGCVFKAITPSLATNAWINMGIGNDVSLVLSVDGETLSATPQLNTSGYAYYIGLQDPGDTEHIGIYKMGCMLTKTTSAGNDFTQDFSFITLDGNYFTAGTHSVKIYAEL